MLHILSSLMDGLVRLPEQKPETVAVASGSSCCYFISIIRQYLLPDPGQDRQPSTVFARWKIALVGERERDLEEMFVKA